MKEKEEKSVEKEAKHYLYAYQFLIFLEYCVFVGLFFLFFNFSFVSSVIGEPNATSSTLLSVGAAAPIINNITFSPDPVNLVPNSTVQVNCSVNIYDSEGESNIKNVSAEFFDTTLSSYGDTDDNNTHYTNSNCSVNLSYGDAFTALANCSFDVNYYANPGNWNCTANVTDFSSFETIETNSTTIQSLLSVGLDDTINFGLINVFEVSLENTTNVTNFGNVDLNLSLEGYAKVQGDGNAMNCSLGALENISIEHEKFNLTNSHTGTNTLAQSEINYTNLTTSPIIYDFDLVYRQNDTNNNAQNETYWRIYIPTGVAGNCTGNIIFGATQADGI